jgi:hypothetical protein
VDETPDVIAPNVQAAGIGGDSGVAGGAQQVVARGRSSQRAHDRVLATAAPDDEDPHPTAPRSGTERFVTATL